MNIDSQLDEWNDVVTDMQDKMDKTAGTTRYSVNHHTVCRPYCPTFFKLSIQIALEPSMSLAVCREARTQNVPH
jgi:hypothetical protein